MAQDHNKYLIPCFKGLDAYDMPKEFARLQAQDLGKVGAMQDLLRGIEKILPRIKAPIQEISNNRTQEKNNASPMVMRGQFALEDGDFAKANEFFEKALDQNPKDGGAYLGKVLSALRLTNVQQIDERVIKLHDDKDYERAIRFSDPATSKTLTEIRDRAHRKYLVKCLTVGLKKIIVKKRPIEERMQREAERQEQIRLQQEQEKMAQYIHACQLLENSTDPVSLKQAGYIFRALIGFKDSQQKEVQCVEKAEQFRKKQIYTESYEQLLQTRELNRSLQERIQLARRAASGFASIRGYSNSESLLENSNHTLEVYSKQLEAEQQHRAAEEAAQKARIAQVSR
jgi:tetratricopeptide (TPR) repeat protein